MGFYGKIYQEMGNAFRNFLFGNKNKINEAFPKEANVAENIIFEAGTSQDQGSIQAGNRWIQMAVPEDQKSNEVEIYHGQPGGTMTSFTTVSSIKEFTTEEELAEKEKLIKEGKYLGFGHGVTFDSFQYDKAGHVAQTSSQTYVLPESPDLNLGEQLTAQVEELQDIVGLPLADDAPVPEESILDRLTGLEATEETVLDLKDQIYGYTEEPEEGAENQEPKEVPGLLADVARIDTLVKEHDAEIGDVTAMGLFSTAEGRGISETLGNVWNLSPSAKWQVDATVFGLIGNLETLNTTSKVLVTAINELVERMNTMDIAINGLEDSITLLTKRVEKLENPTTE